MKYLTLDVNDKSLVNIKKTEIYSEDFSEKLVSFFKRNQYDCNFRLLFDHLVSHYGFVEGTPEKLHFRKEFVKLCIKETNVGKAIEVLESDRKRVSYCMKNYKFSSVCVRYPQLVSEIGREKLEEWYKHVQDRESIKPDYKF